MYGEHSLGKRSPRTASRCTDAQVVFHDIHEEIRWAKEVQDSKSEGNRFDRKQGENSQSRKGGYQILRIGQEVSLRCHRNQHTLPMTDY